MLDAYLEFSSRFVDEPTTVLTDYVIAVFCVVFAYRVRATLAGDFRRNRNLWVLGFVFVSASAMVGGTMHGFGRRVGSGGPVLEFLTTGLITLTCVVLIAAALTTRFPPVSGRWFLAGLVLTVSGLGILVSDLELHPAFTRVDLYHVVQLVGLYCICQGACGARHYAARFRMRQIRTRLGTLHLLGRTPQT